MEQTTPGPLPAQSPTRRRVLGLAAAAGAGGLLTACGGGGSGSAGGSADGAGSGDGGGAGGSGSAGGAGTVLVATTKVPVGGGVVLDQQKVVVTQPSAGTFKAFSAVCTHQSCTVGSVQDGVISCPCHGSAFSATDGSVENGPASRPLPAVAVTVRNGDVVQA